ncbi:thiamine diphosphokinase [Rhodovulum euryhalinum]|uniref:Thiamine diphosphokinase n=1 Tax=Rhodovulum euryhalinum TaxID=35805 RepID=A0A4R2KVX5_9RHOB|nr:thiamine diphosphokinase [Rhodovulum euryhalinum]TCO70855.1 thiamine pyrophosphokinase [Rhodovulum euryhalinum]
MSPQLLHSPAAIAIIGGGFINPNHLARVCRLAAEVVAADGGADLALAAGLMPRLVIGDFDSISDRARATLPPDRLHHVTEQDSTDFEKCLRAVAAPLILGVGFMGARIDHALAAMNVLARHPDRRCILVGEADICFLCPPELCLAPPPGSRLSLFPLGPVQGESEGLRWPIGGIDFAPDGRIGTSNEVTGPVRIRIGSGAMIAILPEAELEATAEAVMAGAAAGG